MHGTPRCADFVQRVRRHRPSELLIALAQTSVTLFEPETWTTDRARLPWAIAAAAKASIVAGNEHRQAGVSDRDVTETVEFKRQLPGSDPAGVMKTVAAFANGDGGAILFGVEDDGEIVGVGEHERRRSLDRLTNMIRDWVRPLPDFNCETVELDGRGVIVINVASGSATPYGIGTSERNIAYYVRRAGSTFPATPTDVCAFVEARVSVTPALSFPVGGR